MLRNPTLNNLIIIALTGLVAVLVTAMGRLNARSQERFSCRFFTVKASILYALAMYLFANVLMIVTAQRDGQDHAILAAILAAIFLFIMAVTVMSNIRKTGGGVHALRWSVLQLALYVSLYVVAMRLAMEIATYIYLMNSNW